jgi:hypothetical protein
MFMSKDNMEVEDEFTNRSAAFMSWLRASGATLSEKIELADLRQQNAGRGVGISFLNVLPPWLHGLIFCQWPRPA